MVPKEYRVWGLGLMVWRTLRNCIGIDVFKLLDETACLRSELGGGGGGGGGVM